MLGRFRFAWWAWLATLMVFLFAAALASGATQSRDQENVSLPPLSVHSSQSGGARALDLWLEDLGYRVGSIEYRRFAVDADTRMLFVLEPETNLTDEHARAILAWVERGGDLVLASDQANPLYDRLGIHVGRRVAGQREVVPLQPVFGSPSLGRVETESSAPLTFTRPDWVPILGIAGPDGEVVAAVATLGEGHVFVSSAPGLFSNDGLARADNWRLAEHLIQPMPPGATVAFDEYHHGLTEQDTLAALLVREPWGWAVIYVAVVLFVYVGLAGRRFGRALSPEPVGARRTRGEYISTLASLLRQGRHGEWLRQAYLGQLKRALGTRFGVRADLPALEFVAVLAERRADAAEFAKPLRRLENGADTSDVAVVVLMLELDRAYKRLVAS